MNQGKYVFTQLFELINRYEFEQCVDRYKGDFRVKRFSCWEQFLVMGFAQLSFRESLRDIEYCLRSIQKKLYHCGIKTTVSRTTLAGANEKRNWEIYADLAKLLMSRAVPLYKGDNKLSKELGTVVYAFDSTTIGLCMSLFSWATYSSQKKAVKVHVLLNTDGYIPEFVHITMGNKQDMVLMDNLNYRAGCFYLMDKAYVDFDRLYRIELSRAFFVTRAKENMSYTIKETKAVNHQEGIIKDELVQMKRWHTRRWYPISIRRIEYKDATTGKMLSFLTNNLLLDAVVVARLYKERWKVELFFKWIKQHLRIKKFYGNSENAVKTQIWIAVCNYLQLAILKKTLKTDMSLNQMMQVISVSLFEKCNIQELFSNQETKTVSIQPTLFENLTGQ
ncbi:MAG: IS4 family transposase [Bacteroidota bacterium]|nr:IS4 family transposase [Bacteroidota bacterium]